MMWREMIVVCFELANFDEKRSRGRNKGGEVENQAMENSQSGGKKERQIQMKFISAKTFPTFWEFIVPFETKVQTLISRRGCH